MNGNTLTLCIIAIVFISYTVRVWIRSHYAAKGKGGQLQSDESFAELSELARRLEDRIKSLEAILDKDLPEWRRKL